MINLTPEEAERSRHRHYDGIDRDLYLDLGFFNAWFAACELSLTSMLAFAAKTTDLKTFDILCKGMDARVKVERFRKLAKIGPNLQARLNQFEKGALSIRNKLAHRSFMINEDDGPRRYYLGTMAYVRWFNAMGTKDQHKEEEPEALTSADLHGWGLWLRALTHDLIDATQQAMQTGTFEIARPQSPVPSAPHPRKTPQAPHAKPDKPSRTRDGKA
jgi:hypothetical protein